jgi:hypothetical protein
MEKCAGLLQRWGFQIPFLHKGGDGGRHDACMRDVHDDLKEGSYQDGSIQDQGAGWEFKAAKAHAYRSRTGNYYNFSGVYGYAPRSEHHVDFGLPRNVHHDMDHDELRKTCEVFYFSDKNLKDKWEARSEEKA